MHKRVLITGGAGFIGSALADRYLADGAAVYAIDNLTTGSWDNFPIKHANYAEIDVADRAAFYKAVNKFKPELLLHCAASYSDPDLWHRDAETNVLGSINAAIAAKYHGAKLCYFNTALPAISSYAISKIAGERYILMGDENALVFRLANIYGPRNLSGPIPTFYRRLSEHQPCTIVRTVRELVYVDDLVDAVVKFAEHGLAGTIDICTGKPVTIKQIYDEVTHALDIDRPAPEVARGADDVAVMALSPEKVRDLGWEPQIALREGVERAVAWYDHHGVGTTYTHLRTG